MDKLKPCPFCGTKVEEQYSTCNDTYSVWCHGCEGDGPFKESIELAVEAWNTRSIPDGYALVPLEPTKGMRWAGHNEMHGADSIPNYISIYKAMIKASLSNNTKGEGDD